MLVTGRELKPADYIEDDGLLVASIETIEHGVVTAIVLDDQDHRREVELSAVAFVEVARPGGADG